MSDNKSPKMLVLADDGANYEVWRKDVELWCSVTKGSRRDKAITMYLSLSGRAKLVCEEVDLISNENTDPPRDQVKEVLEKLDTVFLPEKGLRQFNAFNKLYWLRRKDGTDLNQFIVEFEHTMFRFKQEGMDLPDPVTAFMLLGSCNLKQSEAHLVMTAVKEVTYDDVKSAVSRIFGHKLAPMQPVDVSHEVKTETFCAENTIDAVEETLYTRGRGAGRRGGRGRGVTARGGTRGYRESNSRQTGYDKYSNRRQNPMGPDGRVSQCAICGSTMHWARDCPHSYEKAEQNNYEVKEQSSQSGQYKGNFMGFFTDFVGCSMEEGKLKALIQGTKGGAVVDTACVNSVCGESWLNSYIENLSETEKLIVKEEPSERTYVFGDGKSFTSKRKVMIPCCIGGIQGVLPVEVVECGIPMLLGLKSMQKLGMGLDFGGDQLIFRGMRIKLDMLSSGHYFLPLSE